MRDIRSVERPRRNNGPKRKGLCRIRHSWRIWSVDMSGHQSNRERICTRDGCDARQRQRRGYYGGDTGSRWQWWPRTLWCNHGRGGGPVMAAPEEKGHRNPWARIDPDEDRSHIRFGPILGHCTSCGNENQLD